MAKDDSNKDESKTAKPQFLNHAGKPVFFEADQVAAVEGSGTKADITILHLKSGQSIELQGDVIAIAKEFFDA